MHKFLILISLIACQIFACLAYGKDNQSGVPFNGIVVDMLGQPLKGAKIYTLDKNFAAKSDKKGRFGLTNVSPTDTIHVIFKKTQYDIPVDGRKSMRVILGDQFIQEAVEDTELADLGYGYVKRRELLTPSNGITGEVLVRTGKTNVLAALQGLVPGLNIHTDSFGQGESVSMRGINSINLPTTPLYIVDGVEVHSLDFVNVYDVEYVEVLKDASIYGSRGANGAILVKTKRGK